MNDSFQTDIFGSVQPPAPAVPAASVGVAHLKVVPSVKGKLSPAQQRFNKLLARVDNLGRQLQDLERLAGQVRGPHLARVAELDRQAVDAQRQMLFFLHDRLQRKGLTPAQQKTARAIVENLLHPLAELEDDAVIQLRTVYGMAEDPAAQGSELCKQMLDMAEDALGRSLDREALQGMDSPEEMMEALMQQVRAQEEAEQERLAARRAKRPPTAGQRKAQEQAQDAKAALRSIYRQLASALHPDRETDPAERDRKSALMVQANTAYERGDLTTLLRLQLQAEQVDAAHIARMAEEQIAALSLLLKQQVATLEGQLAEAEMGLSSELGVMVSAAMKEAAVTRLLLREQQAQARWVQQLCTDLECVRDDAQLKRWLREQAALGRQQAQEEAFRMHLDGFF